MFCGKYLLNAIITRIDKTILNTCLRKSIHEKLKLILNLPIFLSLKRKKAAFYCSLTLKK